MPKPRCDAPCPCGSGKKYKNCCGSKALLKRQNSQNTDTVARMKARIPDSTLMNHLKSGTEAIVNSFDRLYQKELDEIGTIHSHICALCRAASHDARRTQDKCRTECVVLIWNALHTTVAALELLRRGFRLQSRILLRNVLESVSVVLHLCHSEDGLRKFAKGMLETKICLASAKKAFPAFGRWYGLLSEHYVHIGLPHRLLHRDNVLFEKRTDELNYIVALIRACFWFIYVAGELPFCHLLANPRYWHPSQDGSPSLYVDPSPEGKAWRQTYATPIQDAPAPDIGTVGGE